MQRIQSIHTETMSDQLSPALPKWQGVFHPCVDRGKLKTPEQRNSNISHAPREVTRGAEPHCALVHIDFIAGAYDADAGPSCDIGQLE